LNDVGAGELWRKLLGGRRFCWGAKMRAIMWARGTHNKTLSRQKWTFIEDLAEILENLIEENLKGKVAKMNENEQLKINFNAFLDF
jgi:hypothetical protein